MWSNLFEMFGASFVLVMALMTLMWVIYYFRRNSGIVDIGWALSFILAVWAYAWIGYGALLRKYMIAFMVTFWAGRLAWYLFDRLRSGEEDPRYQEIRKNWGSRNSNLKFLLMFLFQGLLVIILSLPFLIVCRNVQVDWGYWEMWGFLIWFIGVCGETLADFQLQKFKYNPENAGKICQTGLWYYSRHPNYFFEFIVWIGYFIFAMGSPWGFIGIISPLLMFLLLTRVSGIPLTEQHSLEVHGDDYREYQRTTSAFVPWFKD